MWFNFLLVLLIFFFFLQNRYRLIILLEDSLKKLRIAYININLNDELPLDVVLEVLLVVGFKTLVDKYHWKICWTKITMIASWMAEIFNFLSYKRKKKEEKRREELKKFQNLPFGNLIDKFSTELCFELNVEKINKWSQQIWHKASSIVESLTLCF